jgi:hypothetical protein
MIKKSIVFFSVFLASFFVKGQDLSLLETKIYAEKLTFCDLVAKYIDTKKDFTYHSFDGLSYNISSYDNSALIFGHWNYTMRNDSLNQYGFSSIQLPVTAEWFNKLYPFTDSTIKFFTKKYGKPVQETLLKTNFYRKDKKVVAGVIIKAMWIIDGQKLKVQFSIDGEHHEYAYTMKIERFKDYYGNVKLPTWWNGY